MAHQPEEAPTGPFRPARGAPALPGRRGPRPATTSTNPHMQTDQPADADAVRLAREAVLLGLPGVVTGPSLRAPPGTLGLFLRPEEARGPAEAFLLGTEFAHFHPLPEGSLHLTLPPALRDAAIAAGWAEPHPLAGRPTVSPLTVMAYAPRDPEEARVVARLVEAAWAFARGPARDPDHRSGDAAHGGDRGAAARPAGGGHRVSASERGPSTRTERGESER